MVLQANSWEYYVPFWDEKVAFGDTFLLATKARVAGSQRRHKGHEVFLRGKNVHIC